MTFDIRRAKAADLPAIEVVYRAAARQGKGILRREDEITSDYVRGNFEASQIDGLCVVAERNGRIIGELHTWPSRTRQLGHVWTNITVAVDPAVQGLGVGRALFERLIAEARATARIRILEIYCREDNVRAVGLYRSLGFELEGRMKGRVWQEEGPYLDDLLMGLYLYPAADA